MVVVVAVAAAVAVVAALEMREAAIVAAMAVAEAVVWEAGRWAAVSSSSRLRDSCVGRRRRRR